MFSVGGIGPICGENQRLPTSFQVEWNQGGFLEEVSRAPASMSTFN